MDCEISNLTRRLVSIHCNSGKTYHLPPGYKHELPEQEVVQNASIKRLNDRKIISIIKLKSKSDTTDVSKDKKPEVAKKEPVKASEKSTKKKIQTKK